LKQSKQQSCWKRCRNRSKNARIAWLSHAELLPLPHAIGAVPACPNRSPNHGRTQPGNSSPSMPDNVQNIPADPDSYQVAEQLATRLETAGCEYALGGAIALGFWAEARGTLDVDVTLYLPLDDPARCLLLLENIGCKFEQRRAQDTLNEHNFCQVHLMGIRVDVFLPMSTFYEVAKGRRRRVPLGNHSAHIWDAETLCVFKMMFFRQKDLVDIASILRSQGASLDRNWVEQSILELYGARDPRVTRWRELASEA
jgi:hypothetical protein